jgi:acyl-CoA dehydrogenase
MDDYTNVSENEIVARVRQFVESKLNPISLQVDLEGRIPEEIVDQMRAMKLFGLAIPEEFGGLGLSTLDEILVYEALTHANSAFRSRIGTSNGIGSMGILLDGTREQKDRYLPRVASGEWTAAFGLTEPNAGSDAAGISTGAVLEGDHWVINGNKVFITNGDCADFFTVIVVTDEEKRARGGFTALIVERDSPGFSIGPADDKMGIKGSQTTELIFKDCRVPRENVIGGPDMVGQGFKTAMRVLDKGRLTMGACALGASQKLLELCVAHVKLKKENGKSWDALQSDQFLLADMATDMYAARQMLYHSARLRDQGRNVTHEASMVKVFCTEMADRIAGRALDIFGDAGYLKKSRVEMYLRDVRLYRIFEGTSEIQRIVISRNLLRD